MVCNGLRDFDIHRDVLSELDWSHDVHSTEIGVQVRNGIVTLLGTVSSPTKKMAAVEAAHRVEGVRAVVDAMTVSYTGLNDTEIARTVAGALDGLSKVEVDHIRITVENGCVTLAGQVRTAVERMEAERYLQRMDDVTRVVNWLTVSGAQYDLDAIYDSIERSFQNLAERAARRINIEVDGSSVTLRGTVDTWGERDEAERAAIAAGAVHVDNQIQVHPHIRVEDEEVCYIAG